MKKSVIGFAIAMLGLFAGSAANAALFDLNNSSGHVVFDDQTGKYWVWDLHAFINESNAQQLDTIANNYVATDYFGMNTWHMATLGEANTLFSYAASAIEIFNPTYVGYHTETSPPSPQTHWFGRWVGQDTIMGINGIMDDPYFVSTGAWATTPTYMGNTLTDAAVQYANLGAWVTTAAVPEPDSWLLLSGGLALLAGIARRRQGRS